MTDKSVKRCIEDAVNQSVGAHVRRAKPVRVTNEDFDRALAEVNRLQRELDITNADHIALWLEANSDCGFGYLACRIVEAHEAKIVAAKGSAQ